MTPLLSVKNLTLSFDKNALAADVLRGVNFDLYPNEVLAIVGESGSGKSVMVKSLLGLLPQSAQVKSGEALYDQVDLFQLKERQKRAYRGKEFAFVFQDPLSALNPTMKVGKQIEEGFRKLPKDERYLKSLSLLKSVGIANPEVRYDQYPHQYSGGMRQRAMIAVALSSSPRVLVMDEPTTALDVTIQAQILDLIRTIKVEHEMSILFITHNLSLISGFCDRVLVMYAGQIVEEGHVKEILTSPSHPYTRALLNSIPKMDSHEKLQPIMGSPPDLRHMISGCAFAPRCPHASARCRTQSPPNIAIEPHRKTLCWNYDTDH